MDALERYHKLLEERIQAYISAEISKLRGEILSQVPMLSDNAIIDSVGAFLIDSEGNYVEAL